MAYTVDYSSGTGVLGVADDIYYVVRDTTNYNEPKYRYLLKVTINSVVIGTFKQLPNNNDSATFRIQDIVSSYVQQDESILQLGNFDSSGAFMTTKVFSTNASALETVTIDFGYEFAATANDAPTQTWGAAAQTTFKALNGNLLSQGSNSNDTNSASTFALTNSSGAFLSAVSSKGSFYNQDVIEGQFGALAFLNGDDVGSDDCAYFHVTYKSSNNVTLETGYFTNDTAQGGKAPAASLTDGQSLLYFGCFPANLESQAIDSDLKPSNVSSTWAYYEVQAASNTTLSGNEASAVYRFTKKCDTRYNDINSALTKFPGEYFLCWWNELGGIDNLLCDGASKVSQKIDRSRFRTKGGNAFNAGNTTAYSRTSQEGGLTSAGNETTTSITLNTRENNPEELNNLIMSLANSPRVYVYSTNIQQANVLGKADAFRRCVVSDMQMTYNTAVNDKISNYAITIEISRRKPNVR